MGSYRPATDCRRRTVRGTPVPLQAGGLGEYHRHAHASQAVANIGLRSTLSVWSPNPDPGSFSLSQTWLTGTKNGVLQTIESGWQVYPEVYGDRLPHLFIFFTRYSYAQGSGWYNLDRPSSEPLGFTQFSTPASQSWKIGKSLESSGIATGSSFTLQWQRGDDGNWYLYLQRPGGPQDAVGHYPGKLFGNGAMATAGDTIDFGGEVCSRVGGASSTATGQMGSGQPAKAGYPGAALHDRIYYLAPGSAKLMPAKLTAQIDQWDAPFYSVSPGLRDNGRRVYFYFGGQSAS